VKNVQVVQTVQMNFGLSVQSVELVRLVLLVKRVRQRRQSRIDHRHPDGRHLIFGVDFSGATRAGAKIWMATGLDEGGRLRIKDCRRAETLPGSGRERERCLPALRRFIASRAEGVFGLDFPFGLPRMLVQDRAWEAFVQAFPGRYGSPQAFREACLTAGGGRELKRASDGASKAPFSAYNLRLYRQTFYGISDVLLPVVRDRLVCVLPMQQAEPGKPWILEVCPASTLKVKDLYVPYKGREPELAHARSQILREIERRGALHRVSPDIAEAVVKDPEGDALDSVIAALTAFEVLKSRRLFDSALTASSRVEGYLYV